MTDASLGRGGFAWKSCLDGADDPQTGSLSPKPELREDISLEGLQILLVEDEFLVALEVEAALQCMGCSIVGPVAKLAKALEAARSAQLDGAVLDVNLNGEMVYPLAEMLAAESIPFVFITGYTAADLPERFRLFRRLPKPVDAKALRDAFVDIMRGRQ